MHKVTERALTGCWLAIVISTPNLETLPRGRSTLMDLQCTKSGGPCQGQENPGRPEQIQHW